MSPTGRPSWPTRRMPHVTEAAPTPLAADASPPESRTTWLPPPARRNLGRGWATVVLALLVVVGVFAVLVAGIRNGSNAIDRAASAEDARQASALLGRALFALEDERGLAELWLTSRSPLARRGYERATAATDTAVAAIGSIGAGPRTALEAAGPSGVQAIVDAAATLPDLRVAVLGLSETSTIGAYSSVIEVFVSATVGLEAAVTDPARAADLKGYLRLLEAAEAFALQRDLVTAKVGAAQPVTQDEAVRLSLLEQEARVNLAAAHALAPAPSRSQILDAFFGPTSGPVQEMLRSVEASDSGSYPMTAQAWYDVTTSRLDVLHAVADDVNESVRERTRSAVEAAGSAHTRRTIALVLLWAMSIGAAVVAVLASRDRARALAEHSELTEGLLQWFLPGTFPELPNVRIVARYAAAAEYARAGGDWYDVYPVCDHILAVTIGDVTGHGPAASASMAQLRSLLRGLTMAAPDSPAGQLDALDRAVRGTDMMATVLHGRLDLTDGTFRYSRAGHMPGLVRSGHAIRRLDGALGPPIGAHSETAHQEEAVRLPPDSVLALFTDGLVEARESGIDAGLGRAISLLLDGQVDLEVTAASLIEARPDRFDDAALLLLGWAGTLEPAGQSS